MKAGKVVQIRVNPENCMAVIDLVRAVGMLKPGMSFAQVVSRALDVAIGTLQQAGLVEKRDGFEYNEMMAPWEGRGGRTKVALDITDWQDRDRMLHGARTLKIPAGFGMSQGEQRNARRLYIKLRELRPKVICGESKNFSEQEAQDYSAGMLLFFDDRELRLKGEFRWLEDELGAIDWPAGGEQHPVSAGAGAGDLDEQDQLDRERLYRRGGEG